MTGWSANETADAILRLVREGWYVGGMILACFLAWCWSRKPSGCKYRKDD